MLGTLKRIVSAIHCKPKEFDEGQLELAMEEESPIRLRWFASSLTAINHSKLILSLVTSISLKRVLLTRW
jgi:hypothetical protein